jgi:hypothetical protein
MAAVQLRITAETHGVSRAVWCDTGCFNSHVYGLGARDVAARFGVTAFQHLLRLGPANPGARSSGRLNVTWWSVVSADNSQGTAFKSPLERLEL